MNKVGTHVIFLTGIFYEMLLKTFFMNKNILIASVIAAGTAALVYFIKRNKKAGRLIPPVPFQRSRHATKVFARAKHSL